MGINRRTLLRGKTKREPEQSSGVGGQRLELGLAGSLPCSVPAQLELGRAHIRSKVPERVVASSHREMLAELLKTGGVYLSAAFRVYVDLKKLVSVAQLGIRRRGW